MSTGESNQIPVYVTIPSGADPFDNSGAWLWSYSSSANKDTASSLSLVISKNQAWNTASNKYIDLTSTTMWIAAGLKSDFFINNASINSPDAKKEYIGGLSEAPESGHYSETTNGNTLNVKLTNGATFMGKFFGARNDLGGGAGSAATGSTVGNTNNNIVNIDLDKGTKLYAKLIFGGRSAQLDAVKGSPVSFKDSSNKEITTNAVHKGFETNGNEVWIKGKLSEEFAKNLQNEDPGESSLMISKGIFGGEGYESNDNLVSVKDSLIVAGFPNARKLGLVGGRGNYFMRINQVDLKNKDSNSTKVNNSLVWDGNELAKNSAVADHNIVTVDNSYIGYKISKESNDWDSYSEDAWKGTNHAFSIYGGWSTGQAANNIVSIRNSVVNGNVIGGLELKDRLSASASDLRNLSPNLVSLFNVKLEKGSAVYGTATAEGSWTTTDGVDRVDEGSLKAVNRRRGVVYLSGENEVDSVYARYVHFGQYVDNSILEKNTSVERSISRDYYPTSDKYQSVVNDPTYTVKDSAALKRITSSNADASQYSMRLGDLVARSYVVNRTGFHSSLSSRDSSNVSNETNGLHNFWVGAYVNLVNSVNGDGINFNKSKQDLFKDKENYIVNHSY